MEEICKLEIEGISLVERDTDFRKVNSTLAIREAEKQNPEDSEICLTDIARIAQKVGLTTRGLVRSISEAAGSLISTPSFPTGLKTGK